MTTKAPTNYIEAEVEADNMIAQARSQITRLEQAIETIKGVRATLDNMAQPAPLGYKSLGDFLTAKFQANPADPVFGPMAVRMNQARTEFTELRAQVNAIVNAIEALR
jgi:prefoldin subunit 5